MLVIAHRGASAELPENTLPAFNRAVEVGADMIELDVRLSKDGVLYVSHDAVLGRRRRFAKAAPLDWREIVARSGPEGRYPAVADVLEELLGRIPLNLEVKERRAAPLLVAELRRRARVDGVLLSAFDRTTQRLLRESAPELAQGFLARRLPLRLRAVVAGLGARSIHAHRSATSGRLLRLARELELPVYVWTVDEAAEIRRLLELGAGGVFTNDPRRALAAIGR